MAKVFLSAGHGGSDPGAVAYGLVEKEINLQIMLSCKNVLTSHGVTVVCSRLKDENDPVTEEVKEANASGSDLAASFHTNAGKGDGSESYYYPNSAQGKKLAELCEKHVKQIGQNSRGVKTKNLAFTRDTRMTACLCECAFVDNDADNNIIDTVEEQKAFGVAYAKAILEYLGIAYKGATGEQKPPSKPSAPSKPSNTYTGGSIVDYLESIGKDSSFNARKQYATQYGIKNYKGTSAQNTQLLNAMRGNSKPSAPKPQPSVSYYKAVNKNGLVPSLKAIGVDSSFAHRKAIAKANGIANYTGTYEQNDKLATLLANGKLKKA